MPRVTIWLSDALYARVEQARGRLVPRSAFLADVIEKALPPDGFVKNGPKPPSPAPLPPY